jgi:hypothetical protein
MRLIRKTARINPIPDEIDAIIRGAEGNNSDPGV